MPAVFGVIGAIVAGVASAVGAVVGVIGAIIGGIVGSITAVLGPVIGTITTTIGTISSTILAPLGSVMDTIKAGPIGQLNMLGNKLLDPVKNITQGLTGGINDLVGRITSQTAPVLNPIKDTLTTLRGYVGGVNNIIVDGLAPVRETSDFVRSISTIKLTKNLLDGTQDISDLLGGVADEAGMETAASIATLWRETVEATAGLGTIIDDQYELVKGEIETLGDRLTIEAETALAMAKENMESAVAGVSTRLEMRARGLSQEIQMVELKTEDVPWFTRMMIKGLT